MTAGDKHVDQCGLQDIARRRGKLGAAQYLSDRGPRIIHRSVKTWQICSPVCTGHVQNNCKSVLFIDSKYIECTSLVYLYPFL